MGNFFGVRLESGSVMKSVEWGGLNRIALRRALRDVVVFGLLDEGHTVFASCAGLPVYGYGESESEAFEQCVEVFCFQWRHLVDVSLRSLTSGGRKRRRALTVFARRVLDR
jgi:hypothetical protein